MSTPVAYLSFTIRTSSVRVPPSRWWHVRVYDTAAELRAAARAHDPGMDLDPEAYGVCHHARWVNDDATGYRYGKRGYAGVVRFTREKLSDEIIVHELTHAALAVYRMNVAEDVHIGEDVGHEEEALAYLAGELFAWFAHRWRQLHDQDVAVA